MPGQLLLASQGLSPTEVRWLCRSCRVTLGTLPSGHVSLQRQGVLCWVIAGSREMKCGEEQCSQAVGGGVEPREEGTVFHREV